MQIPPRPVMQRALVLALTPQVQAVLLLLAMAAPPLALALVVVVVVVVQRVMMGQVQEEEEGERQVVMSLGLLQGLRHSKPWAYDAAVPLIR